MGQHKNERVTTRTSRLTTTINYSTMLMSHVHVIKVYVDFYVEDEDYGYDYVNGDDVDDSTILH